MEREEMMDYIELVKALRESLANKRLMVYAADAIEKLQQTVEQMKAIVIVEAQHTEMFDERDKKTLIEMAKSLPLQIIPYNDAKPRWISVEEALPEGEVIAVNALKGSYGYREYLIGYVGKDHESDTGFLCESGCMILTNITHWMPLPSTEGLNET